MTKAKVTPAEMPSTVLIGSIVYDVTTDRVDWLAIENSTRSRGFYGHTDHNVATLYISPDCTPDVQRMTLWHEIMHGLCEATMGSPNWLDLGEEKHDREESVIRAFESPSLLVLRDNPALVAYLTGR